MANLKEFNFRHQTAAPLESQRPSRLRELSELASSQKEEEEENLCGGGHAARQVAQNFQAEQPLKSQGDAC